MNDKIKEIMKLSFHNNFYVDRVNKEKNQKYLDILVDQVSEYEENDDYEKIANQICFYDERIKRIFYLNYEIVITVLEHIGVEDLVDNLNMESLSLDDIRSVCRNSQSLKEFDRGCKVLSLIRNWELLTAKKKKILVDRIKNYIENSLGKALSSGMIYAAQIIDDDIIKSIAINELVFWLSDKLSFVFSHQTEDAVNMLYEFEKKEMYSQIYNELSERKYSCINLININNIIYNIVKVNVPEYKNSEDVECLYSGLVPSECEMMDSIIYMQSQFCEYVYMFNKKYSDLLKKECTHEVSLSEKQIKIDDQQKQILDLSYQIEKLRMEKQKLEIVKADELEMLKKELYSLRNFMFSMQNTEYENSLGGCDNYKGTYDEVVIVGGHNTWHTKLVHNFEGINIVNTDQNVVNWKFLARMKVVVIVTNYISHSMYYRVMEKITNQELIYVSYRNLDHLKKEIDTVLMMIKK